MSKQYRTTITQDHNPQPPSDWHWLVQCIVDPASRHLGGLHDKKAPTDTEEWLVIQPFYAYIHGGIQLSLKPFSCPFDSGMVGYVGITRKRAEAEAITDTDQEFYKARIQNFIDDWNAYLSGDIWNVLIESTEDGVHFDFVDSLGGCIGRDNTEEEAEDLLKGYKENDDNAI